MIISDGANDPLNWLMQPPPDESAEQKLAREQQEADAKKISDMIDEDIKREKAALKKKQVVRVLLLGQAESGKSTTLKNLRVKYAYKEWAQERAAWRSVIQLNLLRSVLTIVDTARTELDNDPVFSKGVVESKEDSDAATTQGSVQLSESIRKLLLRLGPLRMVETELKLRLGAASDEVRAEDGIQPTELYASPFDRPVPRRPTKEFGVRRWKDILNAVTKTGSTDGRRLVGATAQAGGRDQLTEIIASCREDMKSLWKDESVRGLLRRKKVYLEHTAGFFLPDLDRIATREYEPADDDILRARLRTVGIQEYKLHMGGSNLNTPRDWCFYDVGGARTVRNAWLPFFDNVNAIIFLAPVSAFDEHLSEDVKVNRLEDSLILWTAICKSKLLAKSTLILFLNKCDILKQKLRNGAQLSTYLSCYGDRPNDLASFIKYLKRKFNDAMKTHSPSPRPGYFYPTSVIDMKATASTLVAVRDGILRDHLREAEMVL
ncbi:hypothetical protein AX14_002464 [Amanita brunnescens Koide BX004]|nr:hypothetical protein AX14_002464 [Amanita brunnescens Koide BX004]